MEVQTSEVKSVVNSKKRNDCSGSEEDCEVTQSKLPSKRLKLNDGGSEAIVSKSSDSVQSAQKIMEKTKIDSKTKNYEEINQEDKNF